MLISQYVHIQCGEEARKPFIVTAFFPTLVLSLSLSACLAVTKRKLVTQRSTGEERPSSFNFLKSKFTSSARFHIHVQKFSRPLRRVSRSGTLLFRPHMRPVVRQAFQAAHSSPLPLLPRPCTLPATSNELRESQWINQRPTCINC